jgi:hypothetical protein
MNEFSEAHLTNTQNVLQNERDKQASISVRIANEQVISSQKIEVREILKGVPFRTRSQVDTYLSEKHSAMNAKGQGVSAQ